MHLDLSPKDMRRAVYAAVNDAVAVAVRWDVYEAVAVHTAVWRAVFHAGLASDAVQVSGTLQLSIDKFIEEIEQRWSVACTSI